jgi:DNA-directed RNA polymerase subunit RPC12/RpoP
MKIEEIYQCDRCGTKTTSIYDPDWKWLSSDCISRNSERKILCPKCSKRALLPPEDDIYYPSGESYINNMGD